jgi:diguanylate cyclase (GGDEF)-like protein
MPNHQLSFSFFFEHVKQLERQHWYFLVVIGVLAAMNGHGLGGLFNLWGVFLLEAASIFVFSRHYRQFEKSTAHMEARTRWLKQTVTLQVGFDLVLLTLCIHFSGGPASPIPLMYLIYLGALATFFSPRHLVSLTLFAMLLYSGLIFGYILGFAVPPFSVLWHDLVVAGPLITELAALYISAMVINCLAIIFHSYQIQRDWQASDSQNVYLSRLHGLTRLGLERMELAELYRSLAEEIKPVLDADCLYLTRWEQEDLQLEAARPRGSGSLLISRNEMTLTKAVWWAGQPRIAENIFCSPYLTNRAARQYAAQTILAVPLYGLPNRRFLGALLVGYQTRHPFSKEELVRAQQVADVAALLISRTRLYEETQRRASLLEQMAEQVSRLTSDLRQTTLLPAIVESARELLGAERAALHMYETASQKMHCEYSLGLSEHYLEYMATHFHEIPEGQVLLNQNYVLIPDVHRDSRTSPIQGLIAHEKFMAYAVFSLASSDGALGALSLYWDQPRAISSEEVMVGLLFARRAGTLVKNVRLYEQISAESLTDQLTGLPNRRYIDQRLSEECLRSDRYGHAYVLLMIDLDGFKAINDSFGHQMGDSVLQQVAETFQRALRSTDILTRYGGDEFAVILPETKLEEALLVAEKLKSVLAGTKLHLPNETQRCVSACMGAAVYPIEAHNSHDLIRVADQRMYAAKRQGSGAVIIRS